MACELFGLRQLLILLQGCVGGWRQKQKGLLWHKTLTCVRDCFVRFVSLFRKCNGKMQLGWESLVCVKGFV